jgi:hypothetical protein
MLTETSCFEVVAVAVLPVLQLQSMAAKAKENSILFII